ncbi:hypothetical protein Pelo_4635 [Pelomyxa schiedti]|nr:hypothetical protein Pelo_4635 [Pelomyxa schiedti]
MDADKPNVICNRNNLKQGNSRESISHFITHLMVTQQLLWGILLLIPSFNQCKQQHTKVPLSLPCQIRLAHPALPHIPIPLRNQMAHHWIRLGIPQKLHLQIPQKLTPQSVMNLKPQSTIAATTVARTMAHFVNPIGFSMTRMNHSEVKCQCKETPVASTSVPAANQETNSRTKTHPTKEAPHNGIIHSDNQFIKASQAQFMATSTTITPSPPTDANVAQDVCQLCFSTKSNCVIVPCGHLGLCFECGTLIKNKSSAESPALCPFCRNPITQLIQTFRSGCAIGLKGCDVQMDSRTSVHVIKTACRVLIAVFVRPAAHPDSAQSSVSPIIPLKSARLQSLASKAEFVYFVESFPPRFDFDLTRTMMHGDAEGTHPWWAALVRQQAELLSHYHGATPPTPTGKITTHHEDRLKQQQQQQQQPELMCSGGCGEVANWVGGGGAGGGGGRSAGRGCGGHDGCCCICMQAAAPPPLPSSSSVCSRESSDEVTVLELIDLTGSVPDGPETIDLCDAGESPTSISSESGGTQSFQNPRRHHKQALPANSSPVVPPSTHRSPPTTNSTCTTPATNSSKQPIPNSAQHPSLPGVDTAEDLCQLCFSNKSNCVIVPCGHLGLCFDCGALIKNKSSSTTKSPPTLCPFCRNPITQVIQTFKP